MDITIKQLAPEHISGVAELERICFHEPWNEESLGLFTDGRGVGFVALADGKVAAYGGMLCVLDEGQIANIAVAPEYRRKGLGKAVLSALENYARENDFSFLSLEVRVSNSAARALYSGNGWAEAGIRKNFYRLPTEDGVIMTKILKE